MNRTTILWTQSTRQMVPSLHWPRFQERQHRPVGGGERNKLRLPARYKFDAWQPLLAPHVDGSADQLRPYPLRRLLVVVKPQLHLGDQFPDYLPQERSVLV